MDMRDESTDLRFYLGVLRRRAWVVVVATVVCGGVAFGLSQLQSDVYQGSADVLIGRQASDQVFTLNGQVYDPGRNVQTEVKVLRSRTVADAAESALGHPVDVTIKADDESDVVTVVARSDTPAAAARDANAYAEAYVDYRLESTVQQLVAAGNEVQSQIDDLDAQIDVLPANSDQRAALEDQRTYLVEQQGRLAVSANLATAGGAAVLAQSEVPTGPVEPKPMRNALLGAVLGFLLGVGIAFLLEYLDDTVKDRAALERVLGPSVPILAEIPALGGRKRKEDAPLVVLREPGSAAAEAFGMLRTSILFQGIERGVTTYQVTSAAPAEGKSTVAANLAASLALAGKRVVVVDLDLRRPRLHLYFGMSNSVGFTSVLLRQRSVEQVMSRPRGLDSLYVMPSGPLPANPAEIMASSRLGQILAGLAGPVDVVVIDSPPVLAVADAMALARVVDATIVVARAGDSSRRAVHRAVENLRQVGAPVVGAVLNDVDLEGSAYGYGREYHERSPGNGSGRASRAVPQDALSDSEAVPRPSTRTAPSGRG